MYYTHTKSGVLYQYMKPALFQNSEGKWVDCVIYENKEKMTFVRLKEDFEKSFTKKVYTVEELNQMEKDANFRMQDLFRKWGNLTPLESMKYNEELRFIEYQREQLKDA